MAYTFDENGFLHRVGENLSHVAETMPSRHSSFSAGYAFGGLFAGGAAGFVFSLIIKLIAAAINFEPGYLYSSPLLIFDQMFATEFLFTSGTWITVIIFALIGFLWDGLEATGDVFLVSMASIGLMLGAIIGWILSFILTALISAVASMSEMTAVVIILLSMSLGAVICFFCNGIESIRESFSILRAFLGILCGLLKGVLKCLSLLLSYGCFIIILAIVLTPLTIAIAAIIIGYYSIKGFFVVGKGGDWYNI